MRFRTGVLAALVLAAPMGAQQSQPAPAAPRLQGGPSTAAPTPAPAGAPKAPMVLYQLDLIPTGHALVIGPPRQIGDAYFVVAFPDRKMVKVPKSKVAKISPRTKDLNNEVVYQVDLVPSGRIIAADEPALKGKTYTVKKWLGGELMSIRQSDVAKVTKLTGLDAFKAQQEEKGAARIGDLAMEGTGDVTVIPGAQPVSPQEVPPPAPGQPQGNWLYEGQPGVSDAWAPPSAVQQSPGDVPKAAPQPTPRP
jgi:hypothetical protein